MEQLGITIALVALTVTLSMWAGWEMCKSRHQQHGIETDFNVPDFVPPDLASRV